jgi:hypothetical protein
LQKPDGSPCTFADLEQMVRNLEKLTPAVLLAAAQTLQHQERFEDDFSLLQISF